MTDSTSPPPPAVPAPEDGWSTPAIYTSRAAFAPPAPTDADPISQVLLLDWDQFGQAAPAHPQEGAWSTPTLVGPRRYRRAPLGTAEPDTVGAPEREPSTEPEQANRGLLANSRTMAFASLISRITGFLRSSLLVAAIGDSVHGVGDSYNVANNFPNMVYELLLGGVLSSVLVPLLVHAQEQDDDEGVAYTQRLLSIATAALGVMTLIAVALAPVLAAGFVTDSSQRSLTSLFATMLLPEIFFYGLGAMFMAVLNVRHSYGPGAWSPVLNNVVMIITVAVFWALPGPHTLNPKTITTAQVTVLGVGTTLGIAAQALVLIPALRRTGFHWQWRFRSRPNEVGRMREVATIASWVFWYVVASQVGVTVIARVGVTHGAFTAFTNADLLVQMPYGILVVSLLTALMPRLSRAAARNEIDAVKNDLSLGARLSAIALLPITAGLIVFGIPLSVVLFAYGEAGIGGARLIGTALAASAFGLFPFALVMLQLRVFYAMRDGRTPALINICMVGSKVLLVLIGNATLHGQAHIAEALTVATSASYIVGAIAGHIALTRRLGHLGFRRVGRTVAQITAASLAGGAVALGVLAGVERVLGAGHTGSAVALVLGGLLGLGALSLVVRSMRIPEVADILRVVRVRG